MLTAHLVHPFNHKVAVFCLSKTLLTLQLSHLTYISKLTGRNGGDKILNGTDRIRAAYLFIYLPAQWKKCIFPGGSVTCYRGLHAQPCHRSSMNVTTVGGGEAC